MSSGALNNNVFQIPSSLIKDDLNTNKLDFISNFIHNINSEKIKLDNRQKYIYYLNKLRFILINSKDLSYKQKFDFCCVERYLMKLYLKGILKSYEPFK